MAEGVYYPDEGTGHTADDRASTFALKSGVALYGGFVATETLRTQRDWDAHVTILSGDVDQNDSQRPVITDITTVTNAENNAIHVVTGATGATLDGFTVTAGRTRIAGDYEKGAGIYNYDASPVLSHLIIRGNRARSGGGIANIARSTLTAPTLTDVTVHDNRADIDSNGIGWSGGILNLESCPTIVDSVISNNRATAFGGGMGTDNRYHRFDCRTRLTRVQFIGNSSGAEGGGLDDYEASPDMSDVQFIGNSASGQGGGLANSRSTSTLVDVLIEGNTASQGAGMQNWINGDVTLRRVIIRTTGLRRRAVECGTTPALPR